MNSARNAARFLPDGRIDLPEVTLVAVSSLGIAATLRALEISAKQARFGAVRYLTDAKAVTSSVAELEIVAITPLTCREDYSRFMLKELATHVQTPFALCVQWDGYIINPTGWRDEFLEVDYVGAPWPQFDDGWNVGNGGFSLRSKRLLEACRDPRVRSVDAEDLVICRRSRTLLEEEYGLTFADETLAREFAYERAPRTGREFGFHGVFNMLDHMERSDFRSLYRSLERQLRPRKEASDLIRQAIARRDAALFLLAVKSNPSAVLKDWLPSLLTFHRHQQLFEGGQA